ECLERAKQLAKVGYTFIATQGTCKLLEEAGIKVEEVRKINESEPNILDVVKHREVDLVINTPTKGNDSNRDGFLIRRAAVDLISGPKQTSTLGNFWVENTGTLTE
ncbi:Carbamoyl-phosphate synthase large chain, partial [human gut metagenome]